jgi:hypothetical protein
LNVPPWVCPYTPTEPQHLNEPSVFRPQVRLKPEVMESICVNRSAACAAGDASNTRPNATSADRIPAALRVTASFPQLSRAPASGRKARAYAVAPDLWEI